MQRCVRLLVGRAYDDKSVQERLIKNSSVDWTIVRPRVLTSGRRTGQYKVLDKPSQWRNGVISRSDVAEFLVRQIEDRTYVGKALVAMSASKEVISRSWYDGIAGDPLPMSNGDDD